MAFGDASSPTTIIGRWAISLLEILVMARIFVFTALIVTTSSLTYADPPGLHVLPIGSQAPDFHLPGVDGKTYSLKDFAGARILAIIFTSNHCPTAQAYEDRIIGLARDYKDRGVSVVAINPNDPRAVRLDELGYTDLSDSFEEMKTRAKERRFPFPYLFDGDTQNTARSYGVLATPHVFLFDQSRKLRYVGRFDDGEVKPPKSHDAVDAIEALLAGKPVPRETTRVFGCSTKWADKREDARRALARWDAEPVRVEPLGEAALSKLARNDGKNLVLVNVWATWCGPCVAELADLLTMNRMYRGRPFRLVTISLDDPEKKEAVLKVLQDKHMSAANYISTVKDRDRFGDLLDKEWPGPVPYTLLIAPGGKVIYRKSGAIEPLEVKRAIVGYLGRTY
jgi:peroxiredoxin